MRWLNQMVGWVVAIFIMAWRATMRVSFIDDPREDLRARGKGAAIGFLHAHQLAGIMGVDTTAVRVMVSRSRDGDLLIPILRCRGISYARGSKRKRGRDKGGQKALAELSASARAGEFALLAVDGPQGPRNIVNRGIATLASENDVPMIPVVILPSRRWILSRTWDRLHIPVPFSRITFHWGEPIWPEGRRVEELRSVFEQALAELERRVDPAEVAILDARS